MSVILIRHAQSLFNKAAEAMGPATYHMGEYIDARLSDLGIQQAKNATSIVQNYNIKYVYVSPHRRTLETAQHVFKDHPSNPKFIVDSLVKEFTTASCDIPEDINLTVKEFGEYDFRTLDKGLGREFWWLNTLNHKIASLLLSEMIAKYPQKEDLLANMKHFLLDKLANKYEFETLFEGRDRAKRVLRYVKDHALRLPPTEKIAIVSHYVFLRQFTATKFNQKGYALDAKHFENCEVHEYKF